MMQQDVGSQGSANEVIDAANFHQSDLWHEVENRYLHIEPGHDFCVACGLQGDGLLQVHHIVPVEFCFAIGREDLTVNFLNMITLCEGPGTNDHHVALGHLGDFHWYNPDVRTDVTGPWKALAEQKLKEEQAWLARKEAAWRLPLTENQLNQLNALILQTFGPKPPGMLYDLVAQQRGARKPGAQSASTSQGSGN